MWRYEIMSFTLNLLSKKKFSRYTLFLQKNLGTNITLSYDLGSAVSTYKYVHPAFTGSPHCIDYVAIIPDTIFLFIRLTNNS